MWLDRTPRSTRAALTATTLLSVACSSVMVFGERRVDSADTSLIRVAEERGFKDLASGFFGRRDGPDTPVQIELTLEVRAQADAVTIPSCAVQGFMSDPVSGRDFSVASIQPDIVTLTLPPSDSASLVVPPRERRFVRVVLTGPPAEPDSAAFGVLIDESPDALARTTDCPHPRTLAGGSIQDYRLRRIEVEPGGLGVAAGILGLVVVVAVGR